VYFVWGSERSGFAHLHLYRFDAAGCSCTLLRALTAGEWLVDGLVRVDPARGKVFFTGTADGWLDKHFYSAPLLLDAPAAGSGDGDAVAAPTRLSAEGGCHEVVMSKDARFFADTHSAADRPPKLELFALRETSNTGAGEQLPAAALVKTVFDAAASSGGDGDGALAAVRAQLTVPRFETIRVSNSGGATLQCALYEPAPAAAAATAAKAKAGGSSGSGLVRDGSLPAVVAVYGGPHAQRCTNMWRTTVCQPASVTASPAAR
jgi:dipeptidyl-peptidase-4